MTVPDFLNKLKMLISNDMDFHQEINTRQRHRSFSVHFQLVFDQTKAISRFFLGEYDNHPCKLFSAKMSPIVAKSPPPKKKNILFYCRQSTI
jgi:hypothetical protein